jgi:hypothetical protein
MSEQYLKLTFELFLVQAIEKFRGIRKMIVVRDKLCDDVKKRKGRIHG